MNMFQGKTIGEHLDNFNRVISVFRKYAAKANQSITVRKLRPELRRHRHRRNYTAAKNHRLLKDWPTTGGTADAEIYSALRPLRIRSRHLAKNNDYAKRFFNLLKTNVVGPKGIGLQARSKDERGQLDEADNNHLENEWKNWGKKGVCTVDGKLSFVDCQKLFMETVARDGEAIVRKIKNWPGNRFKFALQLIEPDFLDHELNKTLPGGNTIRLGVEFNKWRQPVAYHFKKQSAALNIFSESANVYDRYEGIPAGEIIHEFIIERIGQSRGVPWLHTAAKRLHMLGGYEEAEVVAARTAAAKMGFFKSDTGEEYVGDEEDPEDTTKAPVMNAEPVTFEELPAGMDFVKWDPDHPTSAFEAFVLAILRGAAAGLNVSYVSLANDLRGVSYSSIRQGALDERDGWRTLQGWLIEHFLADIWENWLTMGLTSGALNLPPRKFEKFNSVIWQPRGWQWVDPKKDGESNERDVVNGFRSPQIIAGEQGHDLIEVYEQIAAAKELAEKYGLELSIFNGGKNEQKIIAEIDHD